MQWFEYGVGDAIKVCHQQQCLLIVFVSDDQDSSNKTSLELEDKEVAEFLKKQKFVALKINKESMEYKQFSQFYNVFFFPSIFCISFLGKTIVAIQGHQVAETIHEKLVEAFEEIKKLNEEKIHINASTSTISTALDIDSTKSVSKPLHSQEEHVISERKKKSFKKLEEDDKEAIHYESEKKNKSMEPQVLNEGVHNGFDSGMVHATASSDIKLRHKKCRIQLRLPLGSTKVIEIGCEDTLLQLRSKVFNLISEKDDTAMISLISVYPRQELTEEMNHLSMETLTLSPTGTIIVKVTLKKSQTSNFIWIVLIALGNFMMLCLSKTQSAMMTVIWPSTHSQRVREEVKEKKLKKRSGIHRLYSDDEEDSDKDDGTYNGNSTQQQ